MDYLTAFTGKGGRLLRGTASRLWGAVPGGLRQVRFQDGRSRGAAGTGARPGPPPNRGAGPQRRLRPEGVAPGDGSGNNKTNFAPAARLPDFSGSTTTVIFITHTHTLTQAFPVLLLTRVRESDWSTSSLV
uniref:Uncharacterized protein n=1 Tax=Strix occidentalis caurina TaxID=311401 RepID=A0A8D0F5A3_STROC